jgi:hypothetical protein
MIGHHLYTQTEMLEMAQKASRYLLLMKLEQVVLEASARRATHLAAFHYDNLLKIHITKLK